ncbi:hypothetical protein HGM15179_001412 [Zosterops borbonicus]|uniref:Uncharacterized protein n=1 Tax=Zosterops borbonicus TaxID=364589 RepID=A0A8K1GWJ3_9PASS|nr:hypothetical protein HGM15179_001412 [Zosterops borbonicus]
MAHSSRMDFYFLLLHGYSRSDINLGGASEDDQISTPKEESGKTLRLLSNLREILSKPYSRIKKYMNIQTFNRRSLWTEKLYKSCTQHSWASNATKLLSPQSCLFRFLLFLNVKIVKADLLGGEGPPKSIDSDGLISIQGRLGISSLKRRGITFYQYIQHSIFVNREGKSLSMKSPMYKQRNKLFINGKVMLFQSVQGIFKKEDRQAHDLYLVCSQFFSPATLPGQGEWKFCLENLSGRSKSGNTIPKSQHKGGGEFGKVTETCFSFKRMQDQHIPPDD